MCKQGVRVRAVRVYHSEPYLHTQQKQNNSLITTCMHKEGHLLTYLSIDSLAPQGLGSSPLTSTLTNTEIRTGGTHVRLGGRHPSGAGAGVAEAVDRRFRRQGGAELGVRQSQLPG